MIPELHREYVDKAISVFSKDERIMGLAAGGSFIAGQMDDYSDIDLVIGVDPNQYEQVTKERFLLAGKLGNLLTAFTGEHVGEPRLLICLFGPPLLHVDLKFVSMTDIAHRVEDPIILWERDQALSQAYRTCEAKFPMPDMQWIEDRFWTWVHYTAVKIGRGELFEMLDALSFLRSVVIGPMLLLREGKLPRGVRKLEADVPEALPKLIDTLAGHDAQSCGNALKATIALYLELRDDIAKGTQRRLEAEKQSRAYLDEVLKAIAP